MSQDADDLKLTASCITVGIKTKIMSVMYVNRNGTNVLDSRRTGICFRRKLRGISFPVVGTGTSKSAILFGLV